MEKFTEAIKLLIEVKKLGKDDPQFAATIKKKIERLFLRAEQCKTQTELSVKPKAKAGFSCME